MSLSAAVSLHSPTPLLNHCTTLAKKHGATGFSAVKIQAYGCTSRGLTLEQEACLQEVIDRINAGELASYPPAPNTYCTHHEVIALMCDYKMSHEQRRKHFGLTAANYATVLDPNGQPSAGTLLRIKRQVQLESVPNPSVPDPIATIREQLLALRAQLDTIINLTN